MISRVKKIIQYASMVSFHQVVFHKRGKKYRLNAKRKSLLLLLTQQLVISRDETNENRVWAYHILFFPMHLWHYIMFAKFG